MHALIFWGFVVLLLQVVTLFGRAFDADWSLPGFGGVVHDRWPTSSRCS